MIPKSRSRWPFDTAGCGWGDFEGGVNETVGGTKDGEGG